MGGGSAYLDTGHHQSEMLGLNVFTAGLETVSHRPAEYV